MKYILLALPTGAISNVDGRYLYTSTIKVGMEGDKFGLSISDGFVTDFTDAKGSPPEIDQFVADDIIKQFNEKYNGK